jgi:hypothetical protein
MLAQRDIAELVAEPKVKPVISRRQVNRALRFARPLLLEHLGEDDVVAVERQLLHEYAEVAPAVPLLHSPISRMTLRIAVDSLVLYRSLPTDLPRDMKLAVVSGFVANWMDGQFDRALVRWAYAHRVPHLLLRRWWFWTANLLDEPNGWRFRFLKRAPGRFYGVDVTRCGIVRFLVAQGAPELAPIMCRGDYQIAKYLPPDVTFERTQVIAEGAPHCDFRYLLRNGRDARIGVTRAGR